MTTITEFLSYMQGLQGYIPSSHFYTSICLLHHRMYVHVKLETKVKC